ncbi:universal stress protein [Streptomyces sp. NPDC005098]|uniref:universal stress protein n=1 Tax=Streptomyces sp. NPDC005098 TaxID=3154560 RepID=UPI0033B49BA0
MWLYFRERLLATAVADATRDDASAHISTRVIRGAPDEVLLAVAHGASTLVVGHRSQKSLTHSILSGPSVSRRCTKKADCRVVVVRESTP